MENWKTLRGKGLRFLKRRSSSTTVPNHEMTSVLWSVNWDTVDLQYVQFYISALHYTLFILVIDVINAREIYTYI